MSKLLTIFVLSGIWWLPGDANHDGLVGFEDFTILQNQYGRTMRPEWDRDDLSADFNGDKRVTFEDFSILQNNYGKSGPVPTPIVGEVISRELGPDGYIWQTCRFPSGEIDVTRYLP